MLAPRANHFAGNGGGLRSPTARLAVGLPHASYRRRGTGGATALLGYEDRIDDVDDAKDGTLFYNRFTIRPLFDRDGRLIYYLGVQYDVTEQVRAKEELARLNAVLEAAGEKP